MSRARDLLHRFRPAGAPGGAGPAGVPVDRAAEGAAELEPVLRALADVESACDELLEQARRDARRVADQAEEESARTVADATARADAERAAAAALAWDLARHDGEALIAEAEQAADRVRRRADERRPAYVREVVDRVRGLLAEQGDAARAPAGGR